MKICKISTPYHQQVNDVGQIEAGQYEMWVKVAYLDILHARDKQGFVNHIISKHLAGCVKATGIPLNEKMWNVEFTLWAQKELDYPGGFTA